jgi:aminoglycoside phosphotransferase (APT) family kinase protein
MTDPKGLDVAALQGWLERECPELVTGPLSASLITGGKSNLTYTLSAGARDYVIRRPPLGHVLATAHDMGREYQVMDALAPTNVPVPRMLARCEDTEIIGAPFYIMEKVAGTPYGRASQLESLGADRTRTITERMVDTLVALHAVDYTEVGLGNFGRPDGYLERQVARWKKQLDASHSRDLPGMDELFFRLDGNVPATRGHAIVHGDFRLDNILVDADDRVTAVLDWEMATLGDPLVDVAILIAYRQMAGDNPAEGVDAALISDAPRADGYLAADELLERYSASSGRDVSAIDFHLAFAFFKIAVIVEGIHFRFVNGQTAGAGFEGIGSLSAPLIAAGLAASR